MRARAAGAFLLLVTLAPAGSLCCRGERRAAPAQEAPPEPLATAVLAVDLFFPGEAGRLYPERREIAVSQAPEDRVRRIVEALLAGPEGDGLTGPFPGETAIGAVYLSAEGVAYVDLKAPEVQLPLGAGSTEERQIVMSLVNTVALNVPEAKRVVLLWNGTQPATLSGHLDLTRPQAPDPALVAR